MASWNRENHRVTPETETRQAHHPTILNSDTPERWRGSGLPISCGHGTCQSPNLEMQRPSEFEEHRKPSQSPKNIKSLLRIRTRKIKNLLRVRTRNIDSLRQKSLDRNFESLSSASQRVGSIVPHLRIEASQNNRSGQRNDRESHSGSSLLGKWRFHCSSREACSYLQRGDLKTSTARESGVPVGPVAMHVPVCSKPDLKTRTVQGSDVPVLRL